MTKQVSFVKAFVSVYTKDNNPRNLYEETILVKIPDKISFLTNHSLNFAIRTGCLSLLRTTSAHTIQKYRIKEILNIFYSHKNWDVESIIIDDKCTLELHKFIAEVEAQKLINISNIFGHYLHDNDLSMFV